MRIIKLSPDDPDMITRDMVSVFFQEKLAKRHPAGQFFLTSGRMSEHGISPGERLLFTYQGECICQARAATGRMKNESENCDQYPFYFCLDLATVANASGSLQVLEDSLKGAKMLDKNLVRSQGWPTIDDAPVPVANKLDELLGAVQSKQR